MIQKNTGDISRRCLRTKPLESTNWPFDNLPGEEIKICFTSFIFYNTCCCCCVFISLNCACDKPDLEEIKILNPTLKAAFEAFSPLDRCVVVSQESSVVLGDFLSDQHKHMKTFSASFCKMLPRQPLMSLYVCSISYYVDPASAGLWDVWLHINGYWCRCMQKATSYSHNAYFSSMIYI